MRGTASRSIWIVGLVVFACALPVLGFGLQTDGSSDRLSGEQAVSAALANDGVSQALLKSGYDDTRVLALDEDAARVTFYDGSRVVLEAAVAPNGAVPNMLVYEDGYVRAGTDFIQTPWALIGLTALFLLMLVTVPLRRLRNLDLLALAAMSATIWVLNERFFELSIALAVPLLLYLAVRCFSVGFGGAVAAEEPAVLDGLLDRVDRSSESILKWGFALVSVCVAMICIPNGSVGDVGFASMIGATELLHGNLPYGNIAGEIVHGDTYPIFAYVLYLPAALISPVRDVFDNPDGALWVSTVSMFAAAIALFASARRAGGTVFGFRAAIAWLVFPPVLITASSGSNDLTTAMFVAFAVASIGYAGRSTFAVSLAAWAKVVPVLVLPVWIAQFRSGDWRRALIGPAALTGAMLVLLIAFDGFGAVGDMLHGIAFQAGRGSVLSPWTVVDLPAPHLIFQAIAVAAAFAAAYAVRQDPSIARDPRRICAFGGGIMLAVQLAANYWSYAYLPWVFPLIAVGLLWPATATRLVDPDGSNASRAEVDSGA